MGEDDTKEHTNDDAKFNTKKNFKIKSAQRSMTIHFIANGNKPDHFIEEPSFLYRCENLSHFMNLLGIKTCLQHISQFSIENDSTHVIFHRPKYSALFKRIVKLLKSRGVTVIADFDDLIFDERYAEFSPAYLNKSANLSTIKQIYRSHHKAIQLVDYLSVSTDSLLKYSANCFSHLHIKVHENSAHHSWPKNQHKPFTERKKVLSYFPGTKNHNRDFWQIESEIKFFLEQNPHFELFVVGPLSSDIFTSMPKQAFHYERLPFEKYREVVRHSYINLLPLEPTPFNQCKSALKVIEAAGYAIPTICSPLPDAVRFNNFSSFTALSPKQWLNALELLSDRRNYERIINKLATAPHHSADPALVCESFIQNYGIIIPANAHAFL